MDDYRLEEVKTIIENNLLTPEVLENILKNSTKRIELYSDIEAVEILKYLKDNEVVPIKTREDLDKYLINYEEYNKESLNSNVEKKNIRIMILYLIILILSIVLVWITFKK